MRDHFAHEIGQRFAIEIGARYPARAYGRLGERRHARNKDYEFEREMREYMAHDAENPPPCVGMRRG